jgi:uncharacterized protein YjiK
MTAGKKMYVFLLLLLCACASKRDNKSFPALPGYDITNPVIVHLREDLDEISGLNYYAKDTSVFAINDEQGVLYKIYIRKQIKINNWKFAGEGDYEDIVLVDSSFYALHSDGNIKVFNFSTGKPLVIDDCKIPLKGHNEFESVYFDEYNQKVVLLCKDCSADSKKTVTAYSFDPADQTFSKNPYFVIDAEHVAELLGSDKIKFKPSAAAIHPITKELYIISAINSSIVIADREGKVKSAYKINPAIFKQPEGITFTPYGDLIIANEAAEVGAGNILIFKYKPLVNEKG